jgi:hypothetical protein
VRRKNRNPSRITIPWGRGASDYRPGRFIRGYLEEHSESCVADIYYALSKHIEEMNEERRELGLSPLRRPNYSSFARYFHWFLVLKLVERTDKKEPAIYPFLRQRQFYTLTAAGRAEIRAWEDPVRTAHPEFG